MSSSFTPRRSARLAALREKAAPALKITDVGPIVTATSAPAATAAKDSVTFIPQANWGTVASALTPVLHNLHKTKDMHMYNLTLIGFINYLITCCSSWHPANYDEVSKHISKLENSSYSAEGKELRRRFNAIPAPVREVLVQDKVVIRSYTDGTIVKEVIRASVTQ